MDEFPEDVLLVAKKLNITPEEMEGLAVELSNMGIAGKNGSQAGSALRKVMIKMLNLEGK